MLFKKKIVGDSVAKRAEIEYSINTFISIRVPFQRESNMSHHHVSAEQKFLFCFFTFFVATVVEDEPKDTQLLAIYNHTARCH